jgi:hypothetical protein
MQSGDVDCNLAYETVTCSYGPSNCEIAIGAGSRIVLPSAGPSTSTTFRRVNIIKANNFLVPSQAVIESSRILRLENCEVVAKSSLVVQLLAQSATFQATRFQVDNRVLNTFFFGIVAEPNTQLTLDHCTLEDSIVNGAMVNMKAGSFLNVSSSSFFNISSLSSVTAIYANQAIVSVKTTSFSNNSMETIISGGGTGNEAVLHVIDSPSSVVIEDCTFQNNFFIVSGLSPTVFIERSPYDVNRNAFLNNLSPGCTDFRTLESYGNFTNNQLFGSSMTGDFSTQPTQATTCFYGGIVDDKTQYLTKNSFNGNSFTGSLDPYLSNTALMGNSQYPLLARTIYVSQANVSLKGNIWDQIPNIASVRFDQSYVVVEEDSIGGNMASIFGWIDNGTEVVLHANLQLDFLAIYGAAPIRHSKYHLNGWNLNLKLGAPIGSVLTGGEFIGPGDVVTQSDLFVCCGYHNHDLPWVDDVFLFSSGANWTIAGLTTLVKTTSPIVFEGGGRMTIGFGSNEGKVDVPRPTSPFLETGLNASTIIGNIEVVRGGLHVTDLKVVGNVEYTSAATFLRVNPATFRGLAHGLHVEGDLRLNSFTSLVLASIDAILFVEPFIPVARLGGGDSSSEIQVINITGTSDAHFANPYEIDFNGTFLMHLESTIQTRIIPVKIKSIFVPRHYDITGTAIIFEFPIPLRNDISYQIDEDCTGLLEMGYSYDPVIEFDYSSARCVWLTDSSIRLTSNVLPPVGFKIRTLEPTFPNTGSDSFSRVRLPEYPLIPTAHIVPVPNPFRGNGGELVLDARQSLNMGMRFNSTSFYWSLVTSDASNTSPLLSLISSLPDHSPVLRIPSSLLEDLKMYEFVLDMENTWSGDAISSAPLIIHTNFTCDLNIPSIRIVSAGNYISAFEGQPIEVLAEYEHGCQISEGILFRWTITDANGLSDSEITNYPIFRFVPSIFQYSASYFDQSLTLLSLKVEALTDPDSDLSSSSSASIPFYLMPSPFNIFVESPQEYFPGQNWQIRVSEQGRDESQFEYQFIIDDMFMSACPISSSPETQYMPYPDLNFNGDPEPIYCYSSDPLIGKYLAEVSFEYGDSNGYVYPDSLWESGRYEITVKYHVEHNEQNVFESSFAVPIILRPSFQTTYGVSISKVSDSFDSIWNSSSSRIVLIANTYSGNENSNFCPDCLYEWYFPNGDLSDLSPEQLAHPTLAIPRGSLPIGGELVVGVRVYGQVPNLPQKRSFTSSKNENEWFGKNGEEISLKQIEFGSSRSSSSSLNSSNKKRNGMDAKLAGLYGSCNYTLLVSASPFGGTFKVSPAQGQALSTAFSLSNIGWSTTYPNLQYYFTQTDEKGHEYPLYIPSQIGNIDHILLPIYCNTTCDLQVIVRVYDAVNGNSKQNFTVTVNPPDIGKTFLGNGTFASEQISILQNALNVVDIPTVIYQTNAIAFALSMGQLELGQELFDEITQILDQALSAMSDYLSQLSPSSIIYSNVLSQTTLNVATTNATVSDAIITRLLESLEASLDYTPQASLGPAVSDLAGVGMAAVLESLNVVLRRISELPPGYFEFQEGIRSPQELQSSLTDLLFHSTYVGEQKIQYNSETLAFSLQKYTLNPTMPEIISINSGTSTTLTFDINDQTNPFELIGDDREFGVSHTVFLGGSFNGLPADAKFREVSRVIFALNGPAEATKKRHVQTTTTTTTWKRSSMATTKFNTSFTVTTELLQERPSCATYDTVDKEWKTDSCSTRVGGGGSVQCACTTQETQSDLTVLFGSVGSPLNSPGVNRGGKNKISNGGIAAAIVVPLIILIVVAIVLANLFVPRLACGPFKRYHSNKQGINAVKMKDVGK